MLSYLSKSKQLLIFKINFQKTQEFIKEEFKL